MIFSLRAVHYLYKERVTKYYKIQVILIHMNIQHENINDANYIKLKEI